MGQSWENLLFAHWRVDADKLAALLPEQIPLDTFDGSAWLGITPFVVTGMRARFVPPMPGLARFPEINVRTYATIGGRPGIYFFSLDTPNRPAVFAARRVYRLPYHRSEIEVDVRGEEVDFRSRRTDGDGPPASIHARYRPTGLAFCAARHSFEEWAAERYCLYTLNERQGALRGEIHHPPWPLQPAEAGFTDNTMALPLGVELEGEPVLHFARRQDVVFWLNAEAG
jgi:uncharacterized protein